MSLIGGGIGELRLWVAVTTVVVGDVAFFGIAQFVFGRVSFYHLFLIRCLPRCHGKPVASSA